MSSLLSYILQCCHYPDHQYNHAHYAPNQHHFHHNHHHHHYYYGCCRRLPNLQQSLLIPHRLALWRGLGEGWTHDCCVASPKYVIITVTMIIVAIIIIIITAMILRFKRSLLFDLILRKSAF